MPKISYIPRSCPWCNSDVEVKTRYAEDEYGIARPVGSYVCCTNPRCMWSGEL